MDSADDTGSIPVWTVPGYRHERELGSGATGRVMLARHEATGTPVAIKYLVRLLHSAPDFRSAYRSEAVLLGELHSPHVARLYEYVESEQGAAIVMELIEGVALRDLLRHEGATTPEAALVVLKGSLLGLASAHEVGVVHRDYKPENVLVTAQGVSKLVDFGIAARSGEVGAAAGTPLYMAPEQFSGEPAEPPTDVYAATATFFECITGSRPYSGTTVMELMIQHSQSPIPDELAPEHVRSLIRRGLAKIPHDRPSSAGEFVEALEVAARAGYGEDWEERGQHKLATLVAMLPLLLLSGTPAIPSASTSLATTNLASGPSLPPHPPAPKPPPPHPPTKSTNPTSPPHPKPHHLRSRTAKALIATVTAGLTIGAIAAVAATSGAGGNAADPGTIAAGYGATTGATTSVAPHPSASATSTVAAAATTSSSTSPSATPTTSASPTTASAPEPTPTSGTPASPTTSTSTTPTPTTSPSASASPTASASPPPTLRVITVSIKSLECSSSQTAAATVEVLSDGAATGTLTLSWFYTDANGGEHTVSTVPITIPSGSREFVNSTPYYNDFGTQGVDWGLTVTTTPAATRGNGATSTIPASSCEIQIQ